MSKKFKNIGQLDLFDANGEALFPVEEGQVVQIKQETNTKLQTNLAQDTDVMYMPPEIDPDFYPEELFWGNEKFPDTIPERHDIPEFTAVDISKEQENNDSAFSMEHQTKKDMKEEVILEIEDGPFGTKRNEEITKQEINESTLEKTTVSEDSLWLLRGFLVDLGVDNRILIKRRDTVILIDTEKNNWIKIEDIIDQEYDDRYNTIGEFLNYSPDTKDTNIFINQVYTIDKESESNDAPEREQNIPVESEYYIPEERDPDFYPEEWFLGNEKLPDEIPKAQEGPKLTIADIPEEDKQDYSIDQKTERGYQAIMERYGDNRLIAGINKKEEIETNGEIGEKSNNTNGEKNNDTNEDEYIEGSIEFPDNIPLIIENHGRVDHIYTRKAFSIYETVDFYLNVLDKKQGFEDYEFCIPKFQEYLNRLGNYEIDELKNFRNKVKNKDSKPGETAYNADGSVDFIGMSRFFGGDLLYNIDGSIDFIGMSRFYGIDKPLRSLEEMIKKCGDGGMIKQIEKNIMDPFLVSIDKPDEVEKIGKNKDNISYLFDAIQLYFSDINIDTLGPKNKRESYKLLFSVLTAAIKEKERRLRSGGNSELAEFAERYKRMFRDLDRNAINSFRNVLNNCNIENIKEALSIQHIGPMFASYSYGNQKDKNLTQIFKKNTIKDFLFYKLGRGFTPGQEREMKQKEVREKQRNLRMNAVIFSEDRNNTLRKEYIIALKDLLQNGNKISGRHFYLTDDEKYLRHKLSKDDPLYLKDLFRRAKEDREDEILNRWRNSDKDDLPF